MSLNIEITIPTIEEFESVKAVTMGELCEIIACVQCQMLSQVKFSLGASSPFYGNKEDEVARIKKELLSSFYKEHIAQEAEKAATTVK